MAEQDAECSGRDDEETVGAPSKGWRKPTEGIPLAVLLEAQKHNLEVAFETATGFTYRGLLEHVDEHMNVTLNNAVVTKEKPPFQKRQPTVMVAGRQILFFALPAALESDYTIAAKRIRNRMKTQKQRQKRKQKAASSGNKATKMEPGGNPKQRRLSAVRGRERSRLSPASSS